MAKYEELLDKNYRDPVDGKFEDVTSTTILEEFDSSSYKVAS